jgi:hypothetical protein
MTEGIDVRIYIGLILLSNGVTVEYHGMGCSTHTHINIYTKLATEMGMPRW